MIGLLCLSLQAIVGLNSTACSIEQSENPLRSSVIVPDVLPQVPSDIVRVRYGSVSVIMGNQLKPPQVMDPPTIKWPWSPNKLYTLIMTDPDVPGRLTPIMREFRHWLVVNIPRNDVSKGLTCTPYMGSAPPPFSGFHRYVFVVYKQRGLIKVDPELCAQTGLQRAGFSTKSFAQKYQLGKPIAGNFFTARSLI